MNPIITFGAPVFLLLLLVVSAVVAHRSTGCLNVRTPTPVGLFLLTSLITVSGTLYIYFSRVEMAPGTSMDFLFMVLLPISTALWGSTITAVVMRFKPIETARFLDWQSGSTPPAATLLATCLLLLFFASLLWFYYSRMVSEIPALHLIFGDPDASTLKSVRAAGYKTIPQFITHPLNLFRFSVMPFIVVLTYISAASNPRSMLYKGVFVLAVVAAIAYNSYTTALFPVVMIFAVIFIAMWVLGHLTLKRAVLVFALAFSYPLVTALQTISPNSLYDLAIYESTRHVERFFLDIPDILFSYVEYYGNVQNFLHGAAHRPVAWLIGVDYVNVANVIFLYRDPFAFRLGNASVPFMGYGYADFGIAGAAAVGLTVGVALQIVHVWSVRSQYGALGLSRYLVVVWAGYVFPSTAFTTGLISKGLIPVMVMPAVFLLVFRLMHGAVSGSRAPRNQLPGRA